MSLLYRKSVCIAAAGLSFVAFARDVDDQIRFTAYLPYHHDAQMEMGFNFYLWGKGKYDFESGKAEIPAPDYVREVMRRLESEGAEVLVEYAANHNRFLIEKYPRVGRDGKPITRKMGTGRAVQIVDPAAPGCTEAIAAGAKAVAQAYAALGARSFAGFRGLEEVRLSSRPSFSEAEHAAYRAYAGTDIPPEAKDRACPSWKTLKDFPADRIVDDDYPLLKYYRWFWQHGDGWAGANDAASAAFNETFGRPMISMYAPVLRMPYLWGIGGHNSHLLEWIYLKPNPLVVRYQIAEMQAAGRGTGASVVPTVDGCVRMVWILPNKDKPAVMPDWYKAHEGVEFATIPPDWAREAFWLMFSKRSDGIGLSVGPAVFGEEPGIPYWAPKTNVETLESLRALMRDVAVPLGPLFRNMPERAPEVAVLASHAAVLFSGTAPWDWTTDTRRFGTLVTLAGLDQYVLFDEEIERDGIPTSVKAILMPECEVLTKKTAEKLRAFQAQGGRLIAAATLAPGLKADATLPDWTEAYPQATNHEKEGADVDRGMRAKAAEVKALLGFPLYAETDNDAILLSVRSYGSGDVVFAVNDKRGYGDYFGPWKTVLDKGLPNAGEVRLRRTARAVYDLVRHASVPFSCADGVTRIPVSYETSDGKALLVTERPLAPLAVSTDGNRLFVSSPDKDVMVPFGVLSASGKLVVSGILREGAWERPLPPEAFEVVNYATGERHMVRPRVFIGVSGFSKTVCNEAGVRQLKALGVDFASGVNFDDTATLDLFLKYGLRAVVGGLPSWWGGGKKMPPGTMAEKRPVAVFEKALADFRPHPAMRAVTLGDEPSKLDFAHFASVNSRVLELCGMSPRTPLFPDYGPLISVGDEEARRLLGTDSYDDYVRSWCETVKGQSELAIDFYPYSAPAETRADYFLRRFKVLETGARCAKEYGMAFSPYVQANSLFPEMEMNLPRMRFMAFTDLAYGAEVLNFTCYTPSWWTNNIVTAAGEPTARYYAMHKLVGEIRKFDEAYMRYRWVGVRYVGFSGDELARIGGSAEAKGYTTPFAEVTSAEGGKFVVGDFVSRDGSGRCAILVAGVLDAADEKVSAHRFGVNANRAPVALSNKKSTCRAQREGRTSKTWSYDIPSDGVLFLQE